MRTIQDAIKLAENLHGLLKEYAESVKYEACDYHLTQDKTVLPLKRYFLYRIEGQQELKYSTPEVIRQWLTRHKVPDSKVYGIELITPKIIEDVTK